MPEQSPSRLSYPSYSITAELGSLYGADQTLGRVAAAFAAHQDLALLPPIRTRTDPAAVDLTFDAPAALPEWYVRSQAEQIIDEAVPGAVSSAFAFAGRVVEEIVVPTARDIRTVAAESAKVATSFSRTLPLVLFGAAALYLVWKLA